MAVVPLCSPQVGKAGTFPVSPSNSGPDLPIGSLILESFICQMIFTCWWSSDHWQRKNVLRVFLCVSSVTDTTGRKIRLNGLDTWAGEVELHFSLEEKLSNNNPWILVSFDDSIKGISTEVFCLYYNVIFSPSNNTWSVPSGGTYCLQLLATHQVCLYQTQSPLCTPKAPQGPLVITFSSKPEQDVADVYCTGWQWGVERAVNFLWLLYT